MKGIWLERVFTRQERMALGFILGISFLGLGLMALKKVFPPAPAPFIQLEVRVNFASTQELEALPGVGPTLAARIVADRKMHGHFLTLTDLKRVKGISPKILDKLRGLARFD